MKLFKITFVSIITILLFSSIFMSCKSSDDGSKSTDNSTSTDNTTTSTWTKQLGTSSSDRGNGVITDSSGNIYVSGYTEGNLDGNTNSGQGDIFLVKYNSSGTKQWTKQLGTSGSDEGSGVTTDSSGNIYVTGSTGGGLDGLESTGGTDIFLVKYNSSGKKLWITQIGVFHEDLVLRSYGKGVITDSSGNIYVTGHTMGGLDNNKSLGEWDSDVFLIKYTSSGTKQ